MRREDLREALELLEDDLIQEAEEAPRRKTIWWSRMGMLAACFVLVFGGMLAWSQRGKDVNNQMSSYGMDMLRGEREKSEECTMESSEAYMYKAESNESGADTAKDAESCASAEESASESRCDGRDEFVYGSASLVLNASPESNVLYSPTGLYYALSAVAAGARGETQEELLKVLGRSDTELMLVEADESDLCVTGTVWVDPDLGEIQPAYFGELEKLAGVSAYSGSMGSGETGSREQEWAAEYAASGEAAPVSVFNTVSYEGIWQTAFDPEASEEDLFTLQDGSEIRHLFMNGIIGGRFYDGGSYARGELSTQDGRMVFVLPQEGTEPAELIETSEELKEILSGTEGEYGEIRWHVPRFSYDEEIHLENTVKELGAVLTFSEDADFTGLVDKGDEAAISRIVQRNRLVIDERGGSDAGSDGSGEYQYEMNLNRPFIYALLDSEDRVLYVGICVNPAQ